MPAGFKSRHKGSYSLRLHYTLSQVMRLILFIKFSLELAAAVCSKATGKYYKSRTLLIIILEKADSFFLSIFLMQLFLQRCALRKAGSCLSREL